jgi:hypothetical protein
MLLSLGNLNNIKNTIIINKLIKNKKIKKIRPELIWIIKQLNTIG